MKQDPFLDRKEKSLEGVEPESKAVQRWRAAGAAAGYGLGGAGGYHLVKKLYPRAGFLDKALGAAHGSALGSLAGAALTLPLGNPWGKPAAKRNLMDAREKLDKDLSRLGVTEGAVRNGPDGSLTERTTGARNALVGGALGGALLGRRGYQLGRREGVPLARGANQFMAKNRDAVRRGVISGSQAVTNHMKGKAVKRMAKMLPSSHATVGGVIGAAAGLIGGSTIGNMRKSHPQRARDAVSGYDSRREEVLEGIPSSREKSAARWVNKVWNPVRDTITRGPVSGAAVGGLTGATLGAITADEGKGLRDAAIGGAALGAAGAVIGHKYKRVPVVRGKGKGYSARVISDAEAEAMKGKGFFNPPIPSNRRLV